jgi:uncharacterized protein (TIGR03083 family)
VTVAGMTAEYLAFADLLSGLSADEWERPSRCAGWRVADIAGHVAGQLADVVNLRLDGLGTPEVTDREVAERRGRGPSALADELTGSVKLATDLASTFDDAAWAGPLPGGAGGTIGAGVEALWFDTFVHADDIRDALGWPSVRSDALRASLSHVAQVLTDRGWGPAELRFDGYETFPVSGGGGRSVTGDPLVFVLAATGRIDPAHAGLDPSANIYAP